MNRSISDLRRLIAKSPACINEQNSAGQTALDIAADWPEGIKILIESGADLSITDKAGMLPITYACFNDCEETVKLLIGRSPLAAANREYTVLDDASMRSSERVFTLVASALAERRRKLRSLARHRIQPDAVKIVDANTFSLLDTKSMQVVDMLAHHGVRLDPYFLGCSKRGVYQTENLVPATADILFNLGFKDLSQKDHDGFEPTISIVNGRFNHIRMVSWFLAKGIDFSRAVNVHDFHCDLGLKTIHFVAASITESYF